MELTSTLHHLFLPRHSNNFRAKLLHTESVLALTMIVVIAHNLLSFLSAPSVGILGYAANINPQKVVELTNEKRAEANEATLIYSESLSEAARLKGLDMLDQDYWAHVAPDGTEPWDFFADVGYVYRFAGENLARDFASPESAVEAWMASPSHRENMLSTKYKEIGIAVVEGDLGGRDTTLVVQLFGTPSTGTPSVPVAAAHAPPSTANEEVRVEPRPVSVVNSSQVVTNTPPTLPINQFDIAKAITIGVVFIVVAVLAVDVAFISRRGINRIGGRAFAHLSFMVMILIILVVVKSGDIL